MPRGDLALAGTGTGTRGTHLLVDRDDEGDRGAVYIMSVRLRVRLASGQTLKLQVDPSTSYEQLLQQVRPSALMPFDPASRRPLPRAAGGRGRWHS